MADNTLEQQTEEGLGWSAEAKKLAVEPSDISFKDAATFVAEMTPIVGDAMAAKEVWDEINKAEPNWALVGALGGATVVGLIPGVGDAAASAIRKGAKEVFDVAKRVEVNPNAMGSMGGNVSLRPKTEVTTPRFDEEALRTAANQNDKSREILVEMPIDDFLMSARKEVSGAKLEGTRSLVAEGTPFNSVPQLTFRNNGDGTGTVIGHEGRHRAMALREQGETTIPVRLTANAGDGPSIRWGQQNDPSSSDYVDVIPQNLIEEGGTRSVSMPKTAAEIRPKASNLDNWSKDAYFRNPETGKPEQMYHGMGGTLRGEPVEFTGDNLEASYGGTLGPGTYLTRDPAVASDFATNKRGAGYADEKFGGQTFPVYTNITKVVDDTVIDSDQALRRELADRLDELETDDDYIYNLADKLRTDEKVNLSSLFTRVEDGKVRSSGVSSPVSEFFEEKGFEGISVVTDKGFHEAVIFPGHSLMEYPQQSIKSSLQGPEGQYSRTSNDMRFAEGGLATRPKTRPNRKTDETTAKGRPVWVDGVTGEKYSERSVTFPVEEGGKEVWYTFPTVAEDGTQYGEDIIREHVQTNGPIDWMTGEALPNFESQKEAVNYAKERSGSLLSNTQQYSKGGEVTQMNKMYDEGGLATDGMDIDPVSGNDIPVGSNAEDVRDDVDAKLSSGEYVVPADVVKYLGVAQLEKLVNKAKDGLEDMEENGRIGGDPVEDDMFMDMEEMEEEEEYTLGADLGDLDGYATGGLVDGMDYNAIIDRVKDAAVKDPSITNMLKAKGIFIQEPQPQGELQQAAMAEGTVPAQAAPPAIQGEAIPAAFAEGGMVYGEGEYDPSNYTSSYNPYDHTPGFSIETGVTGQAPGTPYRAPTDAEVPVCPEGYVWDPEIKVCMPVEAPASNKVKRSSGRTTMPETPKGNPNAWMEKYSYDDPETLFEQSMTTLGGGSAEGSEEEESSWLGSLGDAAKGLLSGGLAGGLVGKFMNTTKSAQVAANAITLRSMGREDLADQLVAQNKTFVTDNGLEHVPPTWRDGDRLAAAVEAEKGNLWSTDATQRAAPSTGGSGGSSTPPTTQAPLVSPPTKRRAAKPKSGAQTRRDAQAAATKKSQAASVKASEKAPTGTTKVRRSNVNDTTKEKTETYASKVTRGGGYAKGGLVSRRKPKK